MDYYKLELAFIIKRAKVMDDSSDDKITLNQLIRKEKNARMRLKLLAVRHFQDGKSRYQIASYLKVSRTSVNRWISNYLSSGLHGLEEKKHTGRPSALTKEHKNKLIEYINSTNKNTSGEKLKGTEIQRYISTEFGVEYEISNIYKILDSLGHQEV